MAKIHIKKLQDPIIVDDDRASKLKKTLFDETVSRETMIDLGSWCGTLRDIRSIEIEKRSDTAKIAPEYDFEKQDKQFLALSPEKKALARKEYYKTVYYVRNNYKLPDESVVQKAIGIMCDWYEKNRETLNPPVDLFRKHKLLGADSKKDLADKMVVKK